jgi:hypothetical protein
MTETVTLLFQRIARCQQFFSGRVTFHDNHKESLKANPKKRKDRIRPSAHKRRHKSFLVKKKNSVQPLFVVK